MNKYKVIIVEGIIGAGKSTLTKELGKALGSNTLILEEPDEVGGLNPYLSDYYKDPQRFSLSMQCHLLARRFRYHLSSQWYTMSEQGNAIMDRSYFGDVSFAHLQHKHKFMSDREFETYRIIYQAMTASVLLPSICLRILVSPEVAAERMAKRMSDREGRRCEATISLDYLRDLEYEVNQMVNVLKSQGVNIIDLPWNEDRDEAARKVTIENLVNVIKNTNSPNLFLDTHRRVI